MLTGPFGMMQACWLKRYCWVRGEAQGLWAVDPEEGSPSNSACSSSDVFSRPTCHGPHFLSCLCTPTSSSCHFSCSLCPCTIWSSNSPTSSWISTHAFPHGWHILPQSCPWWIIVCEGKQQSIVAFVHLMVKPWILTSFVAISAYGWTQVALTNVRNLHDFFYPTIVNYWGLLVSFLRGNVHFKYLFWAWCI